MYQALLKVVCFRVLEMNSLGLHSNLVAQVPFYDEKTGSERENNLLLHRV